MMDTNEFDILFNECGSLRMIILKTPKDKRKNNKNLIGNIEKLFDKFKRHEKKYDAFQLDFVHANIRFFNNYYKEITGGEELTIDIAPEGMEGRYTIEQIIHEFKGKMPEPKRPY
jgi:hypothetical protein